MGKVLQKEIAKMKKWKVFYQRTITQEIEAEIEAETEDQAYKGAENKLDQGEIDWSLAEETDSNEEIISVEEIENEKSS